MFVSGPQASRRARETSRIMIDLRSIEILGPLFELLRDGIVACTAPWIAANDAFEGKPRTDQHAVVPKGFGRVTRTGGTKPATTGRAKQNVFNGRKEPLINSNHSDQNQSWQFHAAPSN